MRNISKAAGLFFLAALSVYAGQASQGGPAKSANGNDSASKASTNVKLLDDSGTPTTSPSSAVATTTASVAPAPAMTSNVDGTFSLSITSGADLVETLRVIGFQAQKSILPSKEVHATLPALDLYNVTVHEALDALLHANGYVYKEQGNFIYIYSAKEAADMEKASRVQNTEVFRVYYTPAADAATMIKPVLSAEGQVALTSAAVSGLDSGTKDIGGDSRASEDILVVTDYPENLEHVRKVLKEVDHRPQQILIEATILQAALNEDNQLGVDFNVIGGVDFSTLTSSVGQITGAETNSGSMNFAGNPVHSVGTGNSFTQGITNGLKVGFISNNVSVFVSALEGVTNTVVLANPKVLALNKQKGEVIVGRKDGYLTTTVTESSSVQTVDFLDTGTRLIFRPFIGDDGYIRMEIHPEDSSGGLNASNLPFKQTTEVTSNIMVKDGRTVVIGGLFRESTSTSRNQIPGLGNLPGIGVLFRQQHDTTNREEIIILLTPHIVKDDAVMSDAAEAMMKTGEQLRVGVRRGMMWWGRERLADSSYESAVAEMNKSNPNRGLALWDLDCATNLNPTFTEAIQLKQDLTGQQLMAADNASIRNFVRQQILSDRNAPASDTDNFNAPTTRPMDFELPATQPSDAPAREKLVAENMPPLPATQPLAAAPATQPTVAVPATQPLVDAQPPTTAPTPNDSSLSTSMPSLAIRPQDLPADALPPAPPPTSQPSASTSLFDDPRDAVSLTGKPAATQPVQTTVTQLPSDDATADEPSITIGPENNSDKNLEAK